MHVAVLQVCLGELEEGCKGGWVRQSASAGFLRFLVFALQGSRALRVGFLRFLVFAGFWLTPPPPTQNPGGQENLRQQLLQSFTALDNNINSKVGAMCGGGEGACSHYKADLRCTGSSGMTTCAAVQK